MQIVERCPRTEIYTEVTLFEGAPNALAVRHSANVTFSPFSMVLGIGICAELQLTDHILHPLPTIIVACGSVHGHGRQVVTTYMAVQSVPVGVGLGLRRESCLFTVRC